MAVMRASLDRKQASYAALIAQAHAELNLGTMSARPEKISLWESGRVVPDLGAQLAIAHIHGIPRESVVRFGWPEWLLHATGDALLLTRPHTAQGTVEALEEASWPPHSAPCRSPSVTGRGIGVLAETWTRLLAEPAPAPSRPGRLLDEDLLAVLETRVDALTELLTVLHPLEAYSAAEGELRLITGLLRTMGYGPPIGLRLHRLAARIAAVCADSSFGLGDSRRTEHYALAAIRSAWTSHEPLLAGHTMASLARYHLTFGSPQDSLELIRAAQAAVPSPSPRFSALCHATRAIAYSQLLASRRSLRCLEESSSALPGESEEAPVQEPFLMPFSKTTLKVVKGIVWFHLGRARRALTECFEPLMEASSEPCIRPPMTKMPVRLLYLLDARLACGDIDQAAHETLTVLDYMGDVPPAFLPQIRQRFLPYRASPAVRELHARLAEPRSL